MTTEVNYLKLGDRVYGITPIQAEGVDINEELQKFYDEKHSRMQKEFGENLIEGAQAEWNTQIQHLTKFSGRGEIKIPSLLFNKPLIVWRNHLLECKIIIYAPTEVVTSKCWLINNGCYSEEYNFPENCDERDTVLLTIKPIFHIPLLLGYSKRENLLYTPFVSTIHTMGGNNVCTGNYQASDFWALPFSQLEKEMNRINTFSPASHTVRYLNQTYNLYSLITTDTVTNIVERSSREWRI